MFLLGLLRSYFINGYPIDEEVAEGLLITDSMQVDSV